QGQCKKGPDRVVQLVGPGAQLGREQCDALLRLAEVPQRAGELDHRGAPALPGQPVVQRLSVQGHSEVWVASRVQRGRPFEAPDTAVGGQLGDEVPTQRQELRLAALVDRRPGVRYPLLPVRFVHQRSLSDSAPAAALVLFPYKLTTSVYHS